MFADSKYTQPEVLKVTRLKPEVLQTWVNRAAIRLSDQNPGSGRRRLYSALDVVKLAVMRRMADLSIDLSLSKTIAETAAAELARDGQIDWDLYIFLTPKAATENASVLIGAGLTPFSPTVGDPQNMNLDSLVYPGGRGSSILDRRDRKPADRSRGVMNDAKREALARRGVHAEPVIAFPLGEVVNGALAQLATIDEEEIQK